MTSDLISLYMIGTYQPICWIKGCRVKQDEGLQEISLSNLTERGQESSLNVLHFIDTKSTL